MLPEPRDERFARRAFTRFLLRRHHRRKFAWKKAEEPPDYLLSYGQNVFEVEVTQVMAGVDLASGETSRWQQAQFNEFARRLQEKARAAGALRGAYAVHLSVRENLLSVLREAEPVFLKYIKATANEEVHDEHEFRARGGPRWSIEKYGSHRNLVAPTMGFGAKWKVEAQEELARLVRNRVEAKERRLAGSATPILLLIDAYHFSERDDWATAVHAVNHGAFHTLARVHGRYECQVLASKLPEWSP